jgi:hypothetical protein
MDLCPLGLEDFETANTTAEVSIEYTKLNMLLERVVEFQDRKAEISLEQVRTIKRNFSPLPHQSSLAEL